MTSTLLTTHEFADEGTLETTQPEDPTWLSKSALPFCPVEPERYEDRPKPSYLLERGASALPTSQGFLLAPEPGRIGPLAGFEAAPQSRPESAPAPPAPAEPQTEAPAEACLALVECARLRATYDLDRAAALAMLADLSMTHADFEKIEAGWEEEMLARLERGDSGPLDRYEVAYEERLAEIQRAR
jgi:hypothetical protein